jgi:hypothetical protein
LLAVLIAVAISTSPVSAAVNPYRLRDYDHSGTACASISTTSGDPGFYKTPNSVTGTTFNGTDLLFSCWADNTITAIRPVASQTIFAKDTTVGNNGLYTVTGVTGLGGLAWDPAHNVLWACNLSAFTGTNRKLGSDLGYISLNSNGTATFTHFATAPDGCVNGVDYNPSTSVVSASGAKVNDSTKTVDRYVVNSDLTAGALTKFLPGTLTHDGYVSGVQSTTNGMYLADNHGSPKTLHYTTDFVSSTLISSTTTRRYEDLACDAVTFAPKTVIWVEWFDHNQVLPFETTDTCIGISAPPPTLQISQDAPPPVVADGTMSFTVHVTNPGHGLVRAGVAGRRSIGDGDAGGDTDPAGDDFERRLCGIQRGVSGLVESVGHGHRRARRDVRQRGRQRLLTVIRHAPAGRHRPVQHSRVGQP